VEESGDVEVDERRYRIPYILIDVMTRVISGCTSERAYTGQEISWVLSKYYEIVG
jgi:hypothetical protein